jgi:carotenoid cleavage dioxygenase-like enzyme
VRLVRYHWFAGTGMAHGLRLRGGKAEWFRSRFVIDRDAAKTLNRPPIPGPGEGTRDGNVNTSLMNVGGKLCAVVEAGSIPVELDYELASVRRTDFHGTLEAGFTGHPKFDPITGEQHALAYEPLQPVRYISVDRDGRATTKARIDLPHIPLIHDMAFTQSFIIVPDFPVTFQPEHSTRPSRGSGTNAGTPASAFCPATAMRRASSGSKRRAASPFTSPTRTTTAIAPSSTCLGIGACSSPIRMDPTKARPSWRGGRSIARPDD